MIVLESTLCLNCMDFSGTWSVEESLNYVGSNPNFVESFTTHIVCETCGMEMQ